MLLVAAAIRFESKGPVIFKQKRYGFNNELIEVFKFRSMYTDRCDAHATMLVIKGDSRVTRVGRLIRKTSLDELPQLFNVLTGQLSLVGPRPMPPRPKLPIRFMSRLLMDISHATKCAPELPAGRRSMAGAAKRTRAKKLNRG
jgi:lipopolysaccharide/colanic/teichoic acid biosynthesis glycosyltransferase